MLLLFDIDATLITTTRAGVRALELAGQQLLGPGFTTEGVDFAGRLDPLIIHDLLARNGMEPSAQAAADLRAGYRQALTALLAEPGVARALPGVLALLDALAPLAHDRPYAGAAHPAVTLGLLTGNFADTGSMKLRAAGVAPERFSIAVWGDESPHDPPRRDHLVPVGLARYERLRSRTVSPRDVVIIGDTPHDVGCALAHGCRCLAVATGSFSRHQLVDAGAHRAVDSLSDTPEILRWLLDPT